MNTLKERCRDVFVRPENKLPRFTVAVLLAIATIFLVWTEGEWIDQVLGGSDHKFGLDDAVPLALMVGAISAFLYGGINLVSMRQGVDLSKHSIDLAEESAEDKLRQRITQQSEAIVALYEKRVSALEKEIAIIPELEEKVERLDGELRESLRRTEELESAVVEMDCLSSEDTVKAVARKVMRKRRGSGNG